MYPKQEASGGREEREEYVHSFLRPQSAAEQQRELRPLLLLPLEKARRDHGVDLFYLRSAQVLFNNTQNNRNYESYRALKAHFVTF